MAISAATGFMVPMNYSPLIPAEPLRQLQFQATQGLALPLASRRPEVLSANLSGRQYLAEQIGDTAARQYAKRVGYQPLFQGVPGQGRGFDQVYKVGKQVVVLEAKGGSSQPKVYYGHRQGTVPYTLKVARETLSSAKSSPAAKQAATEVLNAYREDRLVIQVASTQHVYGEAKPTVVKTTYGQIDLPSPLKIAHQASVRVGVIGAGLAGGIDLLSQLVSGQPIDWQRMGTMTLLGGASAYAGTFAGMAMQQTLLKNEAQLLSKLVMPKTFSPGLSGFTGGLMAGAVFSYGAYLMGYTTLAQANQSMAMNLASMVLVDAVATPLAIAGATPLAIAGLTSLAGTLGVTAGTGTAIASLSGAAATNATLAWVGGGTLASGGLGVAGGTAIVATGVGAIVMGVVVIGGGLYYLEDQKAERERVGYLLTKVKSHLETAPL